MKTCDVCGQSIGFVGKFKYKDGYICKKCYKKASRQFTETITQKTLAEIKLLCETERDEKAFERFVITGRIGNYLLVDEKNYRICIPNNRMMNKKVSDPDFYDIRNIKKCELLVSPKMTLKELNEKAVHKSEDTIDYLKVCLWFKDTTKKKEMILIENPVRIKTFAFRQSYRFAERIDEEIHRLMKKVQEEAFDEAI